MFLLRNATPVVRGRRTPYPLGRRDRRQHVKTVEGIYDGKRIRPLVPIHMPANARVIITFLDVTPAELPPTRLEDVAGCLAYKGPAKTLADMEQAIARGAREHRP
jgi:hypothetical protein